MDIDDATVARSSWHTTSPHQTRATDILDQRESNRTRATSTMTSTKFGRKRAPIPNILLHRDSTRADETTSSLGKPERSALATITSNKLSSPGSPRMLRRTKKIPPLSSVVGSTADSLVPPSPMVPLSPPPVSMPYQPDFPNVHLTPPDSPTGHSGVVNTSPTITYSPPTPPSPTCTSPGTQLSSPLSSPVLPRIGTHKRPYYSTVRASMKSRYTSGVTPPSSPPTSPYSTTFPTISSARQSGSSVSGKSETNLSADLALPTLACSPTTPYRIDRTQKSPIVTVPPLPPLLPPSPTPFPFQTYVKAPGPESGMLPVLDLTRDGEDEDENADYYRQPGMKVRLVKYLGTKKSGNSKEKVKNPLPLSSGGRRGRSFGLGSDKANEAIPPFPTLLTSRSFTGLGSTQGGSVSGEIELRMTLAERDINSGNENGNGSAPTFKFRETHNGREGVRERNGGRKLVKTRSSIGLTSNVSPGSSPTSRPSKPRIGIRLREMIGASFLTKLQGNDATRS